MEKKPCKKTGYNSEKNALFALDKIKLESKRDVKPIRAYMCHCGRWHLTSRMDIKEIQQENDALLEKIDKYVKEIHRLNNEYLVILGKHYEDQKKLNACVCSICGDKISQK